VNNKIGLYKIIPFTPFALAPDVGRPGKGPAADIVPLVVDPPDPAPIIKALLELAPPLVSPPTAPPTPAVAVKAPKIANIILVAVAIVSAAPPVAVIVDPPVPPVAATFPDVQTIFEALAVLGVKVTNDFVAAPPEVDGLPPIPPAPPTPVCTYSISGKIDACIDNFV
jgi:hypothetical protein